MTLFWARGSLPGCASSRRSKPSPGLMRPTLQSDCFGAGSKSVVGSRMDLGNGNQEGCNFLWFMTLIPCSCKSRSIKSDSNGGMKTSFDGLRGEGMKQRHSVVPCRPRKYSKSCIPQISTGFGYTLIEMLNHVAYSLVPLHLLGGWLRPEDSLKMILALAPGVTEALVIGSIWRGNVPQHPKNTQGLSNLDDGSKPDLDGQL